MLKKVILKILVLASFMGLSWVVYANNTEPVYTKLRAVDYNTFNEYRYKITDEFFNLRNKYEVDWSIDETSASNILDLATKGYKYLPDSLTNKNHYNFLKTSVEKSIKYPNNSANYTELVTHIENYLEETRIEAIKGTIEAFPKTGNAPLTVTFRAKVSDPTWTKIESYNYTWWIYEDGERKVLWDNISQTHTFTEEWQFSVFLDVSSSHKNDAWYTDVLPFSSRATVTVKEKVASVILKVNTQSLRNKDELKFTPDEASYGLLFDATSSTPTSGSEFIETRWDFWNGVEKSYSWDPRVERVIYAKEWEFDVVLTLKTNELKKVERKFTINIHDPIATINSSADNWYLWDKFTFSAQKNTTDKDLTYSWEIIDLTEDKIIFRKSSDLFTYTFSNKGKYNVKMKVTEPSGETDVDSKIIYINSRPPVADFSNTIPFPNKPNRVFLDATKSYDPDFSDDGKLEYSWIINWERVELEEPNYNGSTWYYTFSSVWKQSVVLEVKDPEWISSQKNEKVDVKSILSVDFRILPRVAQRENYVRFIAVSPEAKFYEWDFWDGNIVWWKNESISHKYEKSGIFKVKLKVLDEKDNTNTFTRNVYIWESDSPYAFISVLDSSKNQIAFDQEACDWEWAYVVNRVDSITFSAKESIDVTWKNTGLSYSWKLWKESYNSSVEFTKKFDELGCSPVKLTVQSKKNNKSSSSQTNIIVKNLKPILSSIDVNIADDSTDPVVVKVSALWAKDKDGVIQSYLWYYYTDIDSEPQDFRATKTPGTSFVLPKIAWNYYFVVVMKDNNEARASSEDITGSKYFITLAWDNLNTPLVKLKVNDSSIAIWEEAIFTANVENILGQDLSNKVKYSWDFDGDGFYDKETTTNVVTYRFLSSWEKYVKVKAKYKWFSNTKTLTVSVSNILKPDFGYISIWNKFIYFDKTIGKTDSIEWDLWDGTVIKGKKIFTHTYTDNKSYHLVTLKVSEWTKIKDKKAKTTRNIKNKLFARKSWLVLFSVPEVKDNEIVLEEESESVYLYLWESKDNISTYAVDYDLEYDSDLNWSDDDDEDNKNLDSYSTWEVFKIELNDDKYQKIRVFIKDSDWVLVESKDITIVKNYVEENVIDLDTIQFNWVSENIKLKIEQLKNEVDSLPKQHKLKALMFVQKLQEEWNDNREKTNVILEFEGFIYDTWVNNADVMIELLESLLVEEQEDKSEKAISFTALKNLIPVSIKCPETVVLTENTCYDVLVSKLEAIKVNDDLEQNKALWIEILEVIATDTVMTVKQKTDFKAILKTFVYGWLENIPQEELNPEPEVEEDTSDFMWLLISTFKWLFIIIAWFTWIILLFYIYYLVANKDENIWFQDFIIEKTGWNKKSADSESFSDELDILNELKEDTDKTEEKVEEVKEPALEKKEDENIQKEEVKETKKDDLTTPSLSWGDSWVPEWLQGASSTTKTNDDFSFWEEIKTEEKKESMEKITPPPAGIPLGKGRNFSVEENKTKEEKIKPQDKFVSDEEIEQATKTDDENIPDWLKWSFTEEDKKEESPPPSLPLAGEEPISEEKEDKKSKKEVKEIKEDKNSKVKEDKNSKVKEVSNKTKTKEENIPDWLKWSFTEGDKKEDSKAEEKEEPKETKKEEKQSSTKKAAAKKPRAKSKKQTETPKKEEIKETIKESIPSSLHSEVLPLKKEEIKKDKIQKNDDKTTKNEQKENKKEEKKSEKQEKSEELWDDGMVVPDWLQTDENTNKK